MSIKEVIFDLGQVLVPFDWGIAVKRLAEYLPDELARSALKDPRELLSSIGDLTESLEIGAMNFSEFYGVVASRTGLKASEDFFRKAWCEIFRLDSNVVGLGRRLAANHNVWLASNTNEAHYEYIVENFPDILFFKKAALSYELGEKKPEIAYFKKAISLFGIKPEEAVFIDDLKENVEAANRIGIKSIHYMSFDSLLDSLTELGLFSRSGREGLEIEL